VHRVFVRDVRETALFVAQTLRNNVLTLARVFGVYAIGAGRLGRFETVFDSERRGRHAVRSRRLRARRTTQPIAVFRRRFRRTARTRKHASQTRHLTRYNRT